MCLRGMVTRCEVKYSTVSKADKGKAASSVFPLYEPYTGL